MPRRITQRGPLQQVTLRGKTIIIAAPGDSLYPAVIPRSATGGATNYAITCNAGSFTLTGSSATISRNRALTASAGSYTYTGSQTTIKRNRALTANSGSYTYTGQTVTISRNRALTASAGSYSYTGQQATILKSKLLNASSGSYTYTGQTVEISRNRSLAANAGSYALTGQSVDITYTPSASGYSITALPGSYVLTGEPVAITLGVAANRGGGIGHGRKKKPVWIEENGQILVFRNASDASVYLAQKKQPEQQQKTASKQPSKPYKPVAYEVIDLSMLEGYESRLKSVFAEAEPVRTLFDTGQINLLLELARKVREWQDEEDLEILLLAA